MLREFTVLPDMQRFLGFEIFDSRIFLDCSQSPIFECVGQVRLISSFSHHLECHSPIKTGESTKTAHRAVGRYSPQFLSGCDIQDGNSTN